MQKDLIVPIYKEEEKHKWINFRTICLSSISFKIFTRIIEEKLRKKIKKEHEERTGSI